MRVTAIIPAAGSGNRMNSAVSKQFLTVAGKPILAHTLEVFESASAVDAVHLVIPPPEMESVREQLLAWGFRKIAKVVPGGLERQDSVRAGIESLDPGTAIVVIHDAVRPLVTAELINRCVSAMKEERAVSAGVPVKDTVKEVRPDGRVVKTCDRSVLWLTQTPQVFHRDVIEEAHRSAIQDGFRGTDDTSLVERIGIPVRMIPGDYRNVKVTTPEDLLIAEAFLNEGKRLKDKG